MLRAEAMLRGNKTGAARVLQGAADRCPGGLGNVRFKRTAIVTLALLASCARPAPVPQASVSTTTEPTTMKNEDSKRVVKSDAEWRKELTSEQYRILRQKGTERAFTGKYWDTKDDGTYVCGGCGETLFTSKTKFESGCGWPSFYDAIDSSKV